MKKITSLWVVLFTIIALGFVSNNAMAQNQSSSSTQEILSNPATIECDHCPKPTQEEMQRVRDQYQPRIERSNLTMPKDFKQIISGPKSGSMQTNQGTDFWLAFTPNYSTGEILFLDITGPENTTGTVSVPGIPFTQDFTITANTITRITIPSTAQLTNSGTIQSLGVHVVSLKNVTVYGANRIAYSTDSFLGIPVAALGTNYLTLSYGGLAAQYASNFAIVSPYDNNVVTITPKSATANGQSAGVPFNITLNQGQTYLVKSSSTTDMSGSVIQSSLPVAVFAGAGCVNIPAGFSACDMIVEQMPPLSAYGNEFVTCPLASRTGGDTWRFMASQNNTTLKINGVVKATLNFGDFYETILKPAAYVQADKPILTMQYSNGINYDNTTGDPFSMIVPPYQQFLNDYTFATPAEGFTTNYFNVTVETTGISGMQMDGSPLNASSFTAISGTNYSAASFPIAINSTHHVTNTIGKSFGISVYGFTSADSYGYPGGSGYGSINSGGGPVIALTEPTVDLFCTSNATTLDLVISASITDSIDPFVQSAKLYYRKVGTTTYTSVPMTLGSGTIYSATISASATDFPGVDFYVLATDGQTITTSPAVDPANSPYSVGVDNAPPQTVHTPVTSSPVNTNILISANVTDATDYVQSVKLYYRKTGGTPIYTVLDMAFTSGDTYTATIPGAQMTDQGIDYYIKSIDNHGASCTSGFSDSPYKIVVSTVTAPNAPTSITATSNPICIGSSTQLTANGADGTVYWYTGSCGGSQLTTGNPITVNPASTTTYYAKNYNNSLFSAGCASITVTVDPVSVGGNINGTNSIIYGNSTGTMTLSGHTGTVAKWQKKISTASDWSDISNTTATYSETPSSPGTWQYRAQVKSGSCSETYSGVFSVSVATKTLTIGGSFVPNTKVYDATVASSILTNNLTLVGKVGSDVVSLTAVAVFADKNAGNSKTVSLTGSTITGANASYYTLSLTGAPTASANITAKAINVTAQTDSRIYNGTASSSVAPIVDALQTGDVISTSPTQVYNNKNVGTGKTMTASGLVINDGNSGNNYSVSYVPNATGVITAKAINVTAQTDSRIYNGTASSSVAPIVDALQTGDVISTSPTQVYNNKNVGTGKTMTASGLVINDGNSGNNYSVSYVPNATGVITAKAINVTAQTDSRIYNGTASSSVAPIVDALQTGDVISTSPTQVYNNKNVGTGKTMTASGLVINDGNSGNNYSVSYVPNATGVITAKAINVTAQTDSRIYNGTASSSVAPIVDALQTGDVISTSPTQVYNNKNVGTGKTMTASGLVINDGNSGNNYSVSYVPNTTGVITAKAINVTAQTDSRIYNGTASSSVAPVVDALQTGDAISTSPTQVYNNKNVGTGKTMTASGLVINDGNSGNNYSVSYVPNATGVITAKAINVTAQTDSRIYNGTTSSSVAPVVDALQTGDVVSTSPTQVYNNKNVGTGKTMTASGLVINDGNSGNNYSVSYVPNATGVITAKAINVTAVSDSKIYDDNTSSDGIPTIETAAIQTGDFVSTQPHQVYDTKFVGTGKTMTASGLVLNDGNNGNNYSIRYLTNTTGEIIPGPAHHFSITGPDEVVAGSASSDFTIQVYDQYENATTVTGATTFALTTSSTGTTIIFNPNPVTMANGNGSTTFTYQDSKVGNYTITAARTSGNDAGLVGKSATHNIEVNLTPWQACNTSVSADGVTEYFPDGSIAPVYGKFELSATGLSTAQNDVHNFAYQTLGNKGTIIAHAVDIENGGWLGVEMRESCASNAKTVLIKSHIYNPNVIIGYRSNTGKSMSSVSQVTQLTSWLKIQRNGSQFTIYSSNNGTLWQKRYTTTVNMSTNILAGIFTESVRSDRTSIAQFDHVEVSSSLKSSEILDDETIATEQQVDIYPNPADELVNILMPDNESKVKVTLTSMQGNVILTTIFYGSEAQLNTSHINPGVYVLRFETDGNVITKRLVIM